ATLFGLLLSGLSSGDGLHVFLTLGVGDLRLGAIDPRIERCLIDHQVAMIEQIEHVQAISLRDGHIIKVGSRSSRRTGYIADSDKAGAIDLEGRKERRELLGVGLIEIQAI